MPRQEPRRAPQRLPSQEVTFDEIEGLVAPVRAMTEGRNGPMFDLGRELHRLGLSSEECHAALLSVSSEPHIRKKAGQIVRRLYGRSEGS
jgi:hypothetical protein